ncbi:iron complex outermembrane recepter protein [Sphingomonas sp. F9_3S_D5_B_2]
MTGTRTRHLRHLLFSSAAALTCAGLPGTAHAQVAPEPLAGTADAVPQDQIVVTGTRRTDRTSTNSASPVDVISSAELTQQPTANLLDTIKNVVPSFFVPQNTISDASSFVRAPSLRGLPGDEVLVQVNGKRFNRSALVQVYTGGDTGLSFGSQGADISAIPSIAIKNLQVLREGATAQYGSDAIAGVMNFGLRNDRNGVELQARYGQFYDHGHTKLDSGKSRQIAGNVGIGIGATGFIDLAGEWYKDDGTSRGKTRPLAVIFAQNNPALADQLPHYPLPAQIWGLSPQHGWKAALNSGFDLTPNSQVYLTVVAARNKANESFNYRSPISGDAVDIEGVTRHLGANGAFTTPFYLTPCPAGNATCPAGGFVQDANIFNFTDIYPAGFTPRFVGITKERWGTAGYKGSLANGLTWDLSGTLAKNTLTLSMYNSLNASYGPESQTSFQFGQLSQKERNLNADFTYPINVGFYSPLTIAWGAESRKETYGQSAGDVQSYSGGPYAVQYPLYVQTAPGVYALAGTSTDCTATGAVCTAAKSPGASGYGGTSPEAAGKWSQTSWGVYGDLETDITQQLSVGLAGRYEHYSTFGGSFVYKANALYKISPQLSVRGTIGTGFHAPSPGQSNDEILTTNFVAGNQIQTGTYPVESLIAQYYGATTLKPEKSKNYGAGVVFRPIPAFTVTVDGYIIDVRDRIGISQNFDVTAADIALEPALAAVGDGGNVNYFTNGFDTRTKGIDAVATYRHSLMGGYFTGTLAYNYNKSKVTKYDPGVISAAQIIDVAHLAPNHRATLSGSWSGGAFGFNVRENYYSWWEDAVDYPTAEDANGNITAAQKFGSKFTTDVDVSYTFARMFTLTLGASNVFNTHPDKIRHTAAYNPIYELTHSTADGQVYPRPGGPFGINGGFWYVRLRAKIGESVAHVAPPPAELPPPPPAMQTCADGSMVQMGAPCPMVQPVAPPPPPPPPPPAATGERGR